MVNERSQPRETSCAPERFEHGASRSRTPDGFDRFDDIGSAGTGEHGDEDRRPLPQAKRPSLSSALRHERALAFENLRHSRPGSPKAPGQKPRQHPPNALAACAPKNEHFDRRRATVMVGQDSRLAVVDVQGLATASALVGSDRVGVGQCPLVRGEIPHFGGDERSAFLAGRIWPIEAWCGWKRWVNGGRWHWFVHNFQLPRRFPLVQISSARLPARHPPSATLRDFLDRFASIRPARSAERHVTPDATSRDERGTNAHHSTGSIRDVTSLNSQSPHRACVPW